MNFNLLHEKMLKDYQKAEIWNSSEHKTELTATAVVVVLAGQCLGVGKICFTT